MKNLITVFVLFFALGVNAAGKNVPSELIEVAGRDIILSNDGTGVVRNVECDACSSNVLRITHNTRAFEKGQPVDLVSSRKRYINKVFMLRFDVATREVLVIRWQ